MNPIAKFALLALVFVDLIGQGLVFPIINELVMGITTAAFTFAAGVLSLMGGLLMAIDINVPFYFCAAAAVLALILIRTTWRNTEVRALAGS